MKEFLIALKFLIGTCFCLMLLWFGSWSSYLYYFTDQNIHYIFSVTGVAFIIYSFAAMYILAYEIKQDIK
tara:strand:+ start:213 stop:422 length:210 start_codon:yes stop_codon:yes gene_type:complete